MSMFHTKNHWPFVTFCRFFVRVNDKIVKKWQLNLKEYGPGECPDCHGTKQCRKCHGQGFLFPLGHPELFKTCQACGGTGTCQRCDIPVRQLPSGGGPTGIGNGFK